jgi:hypothetical protein
LSAFVFQPDEDGSISLESAVFQALGAASMCWENLSRTGIFQAERAREIGDALLERIKEDTVRRLNQVPVGELRAELESRGYVVAASRVLSGKKTK